jgi:hypothetical protein
MATSAEFIKMIEKLANKFGFDVKDATAFLAEKSDNESDAGSTKVKLSPIETARKNLATWNKKLTANKFKDEDAKTKHIAKIQKEQTKLDKLEAASPKTKKQEDEQVPVTPKKEKKTKEEEVPVTPKKEKKTKEEAPNAPKKEKRIPRMSPTLQKQLAEVLSRSHLDASDERKRAFLNFVEGLSDEDFKTKGLMDHMRDFAKSLHDAAGSDWGGGGGGGPQFDAVPPKKDGDVVETTLEDLQAINITATIDPIGTYWDADNGRYVKGPDAEPDEDCDVVNFEGKEYGVGEKSGRIYFEVEGRDEFQGFIGVGKFKAMKRC